MELKKDNKEGMEGEGEEEDKEVNQGQENTEEKENRQENEVKEDKEIKDGKENKEEEENIENIKVKKDEDHFPIDYDVDFKKEMFKFYVSNSTLSLEELYNSENKKIKKKNRILIFYDNYYILFLNQGLIKFTFPDSTSKEIFIANNMNIFKIIDLYPNCKYYVKKDNEKIFKDESINMLEKYVEIKIVKYTEINEREYKETKIEITLSNQTSLLEISSIYDEYLENKNIIKTDPKFKITDERTDFFIFLENEIKNNNKFIPLCGPEGIGKTTSILAFFKENKANYFYYYVNIKKIYECLENRDIKCLKKIIINELYNSIAKFDILKDNYEELNDLIIKKLNPLDLVTKIIELLNLKRIYIILDQYKTFYDENYQKLKNLLKTSLLDKGNTIILISSMNEIDVINLTSIIYI